MFEKIKSWVRGHPGWVAYLAVAAFATQVLDEPEKFVLFFTMFAVLLWAKEHDKKRRERACYSPPPAQTYEAPEWKPTFSTPPSKPKDLFAEQCAFHRKWAKEEKKPIEDDEIEYFLS